MKRSLVILCLFSSARLFSQPATEIILFDLSIQKKGITISNPRNITNHKGYDNQPSFHSKLPIIYYSSFNDEGRAEIKSYNYGTKVSKDLTHTTEREYSPTLTPDEQFLSCIIQRDNGAQDLGKIPVDGGDALTILSDRIVGYHTWIDNSHLALFILGKDGQPSTLHYLRLPTKTDTLIAENVGRSLHRVPGENAFSFVHKVTDAKWFIKKYNPRKSEISVVAATLPKREDMCWAPDGTTMFMTDDAKIYWMDSRKKDKTWNEVKVESGVELLKGLSRVAVSPDGKTIAVVVTE